MKKIALVLATAALFFASCSNGADTAGSGLASGETGGGSTTNPTTPTNPTNPTTPITPADPTDPTDPSSGITVDPDGTVTISSSKMVYIGEDSETLDAVTYSVKKYAQLVIDDNPYFYTYYKLYFLNGKLRRLYSFDHGIGREMDYKYDEFVEHQCGLSEKYPNIYAYHENGKIEAHIYYGPAPNIMLTTYANFEDFYDTDGRKIRQCVYYNGGLYSKTENEYYPSGKTKQTKVYSTTNSANPSEGTVYLSLKATYTEKGETESSISYSSEGWETSKTLYTYYSNGNKKTEESYSNGKLSRKYTYLENGKTESEISYASDGVTETSKRLYTYYSNGNKKTEENYSIGLLSSKHTYYESGNEKTMENYKYGIKNSVVLYFDETSKRTKLRASFDQDSGELYSFSCFYSSGYIKYYYSSYGEGGTLYTFADNTTRTDDTSLASSTQTLSQAQAEAKLAELMNEQP